VKKSLKFPCSVPINKIEQETKEDKMLKRVITYGAVLIAHTAQAEDGQPRGLIGGSFEDWKNTMVICMKSNNVRYGNIAVEMCECRVTTIMQLLDRDTMQALKDAGRLTTYVDRIETVCIRRLEMSIKFKERI
jgi:hypothetical protein